MELNDLTNAELKIKMQALENDYEITKSKVAELLQHLEDLDNKYVSVRTILEKRTSNRLNNY